MFCDRLTMAGVALVFVILLVIKSMLRLFKSNHPLPPGPKSLPLIGNLLDMPTEKEWVKFARWGETYGDICSVTVFGQTLVILNSAQVAVDMLDKKSAIYSDRPVLQMGGELVGWKNTLIGTHSSIKRFYPSEELEARSFLRQLLSKPDGLATHVRNAAGAVILRISHGYEVQQQCDPFVALADKATEQFSLATAPGGFLVDLIPALRHLPSWFPGAGFQLTARKWASTLSEMVEAPYNFVKQDMAAGTARVSFCSTLMEAKVLNAEEEFDLKWCAASLYSGAADTTVSALYSFFLGIAMHPGVLTKAQEEIDRVVGNDRLPTFADRPFLPYINALVLEVLRWHTVTPTAVPHRVMQDDIHDGYFIPKGSLVIPNVWRFAHDPKVYSHPFEFNPDRFLGSEGRKPERDPREVCFGFGRRSCPGSHLADASIFITCAMVLAVFNISKCIENGVVVEPVHDYTQGTISHPMPFRCSVLPRSEKAASLILSHVEDSK